MKHDDRSKMGLEIKAALDNQGAFEAYARYNGRDPFLVERDTEYGDADPLVKYIDHACRNGDIAMTSPGPEIVADYGNDIVRITWTTGTEELNLGCVRHVKESISVPLPVYLTDLVEMIVCAMARGAVPNDSAHFTNAEALDFFARVDLEDDRASGTDHES